ncbi:hypothetical protein PIB30_019622 [Stylosanthes scabra]|uniref:Uncharacterized protein n=1 Tax=Stylosanthes scabra TaxID=79078 RepID=A0ABU6R8V1_9FABA|nr:hypothetical protein [Stylosanthes scabra]
MAITKNPTKRARVQGENASASAHYMAKWLTEPSALHKYVENFEARLIIPPRYIEADYTMEKNFKVLQTALKTQNLIEFVEIHDDYYPNLVKAVYSTLKYVVDRSSDDEEDEEDDEEVIPRIEFDLGNRHYMVSLDQWLNNRNYRIMGQNSLGVLSQLMNGGEYDRVMVLESLNIEDPNHDPKLDVSCKGLSNEHRILMYLLSYVLLPRRNNHGTIWNEDILILWAIVTDKVINWPYYMVHHMLYLKGYNQTRV